MRYLISVLLIVALTSSANVFAHAVVTKNSLALQPVPVNQASRVELSFNSS